MHDVDDATVVGRVTFADGGIVRPSTALPLLGEQPMPNESIFNKDDTTYVVEGLLRQTGQWVRLDPCDTRVEAEEVMEACSDKIHGWVHTEDAHIRTEEFAAYRIQLMVTVRWMR